MPEIDWRRDPLYAEGYDDGWRGRPAATGDAPYLAGWRAGETFRSSLVNAGFVQRRNGDFIFDGRLR